MYAQTAMCSGAVQADEGSEFGRGLYWRETVARVSMSSPRGLCVRGSREQRSSDVDSGDKDLYIPIEVRARRNRNTCHFRWFWRSGGARIPEDIVLV